MFENFVRHHTKSSVYTDFLKEWQLVLFHIFPPKDLSLFILIACICSPLVYKITFKAYF